MEGILLDSQRLMTSIWMLMIDLESVSKSWRCILQIALHRFSYTDSTKFRSGREKRVCVLDKEDIG